MTHTPNIGEEAFRAFIRRARPGVVFASGIVLLLAAGYMKISVDVAYVAYAFATVATIAYLGRGSLRGVLWGATKRSTMFVFGVLVPLCFVAVSVLLDLHANALGKDYRVLGDGAGSSPWIDILAAPILEEFLFRLWLQTRLQAWLGALAGAALTCVLFYAWHFTLSLELIVGCVYLTVMRAYTKSLGLTLTAHITYNASLTLAAPLLIGLR